MGNMDTITKNYMKDKSVFADAFNFLIYGGARVIQPEMLRPADTAELGIFEDAGQEKDIKFLQRFRDNVNICTMMQDENAAYLILAVEEQTEVHYAMPVKNMGYDYLRYNSQVENIAAEHRKEKTKNISSGEFLSGFYKDDKLIPVITLVIYFSANEWDGPRSLHDMLEIQDERVLRYVQDYRLNLIEPYGCSDEELESLQSSLREVMLFIKYSKDKQKLRRLLQEDDRYTRMDKRAALVINAATNMKIKVDSDQNGKEEAVDMCQAVAEMMEDARAEGLDEGKKETQILVAEKLINRGGFTSEEISELSGLPEEEVEKIIKNA
jgi:hypothetical protein